MSKRAQIRQSQVITTFGPGSLLDLPDHSVIVGGLDSWTSAGREEIYEARLIAKLKFLLTLPQLRLSFPPRDLDDPNGPDTGVTAYQFPEWFITQDVVEKEKGSTIRSRLLVHRRALTKGKFIDQDRKKRPVVPVRFVRACRKGHIGDINWSEFVHRGPTTCQQQLLMEERGTSGDLSEIWVRCECKAERPLFEASVTALRALGPCDGARPWLGRMTQEKCGEPSRLLVRTASNAYFSQVMSVISLPDRKEALVKAVDAIWDNLEAVETLDDLKYERKKAKVKAALEGYQDGEVWAEIQERKGAGGLPAPKSIKEAELEVLVSCEDEAGNDKPDGNFYARNLPRDRWDAPWMTGVERVVLVHRLREVVAQVGFTRFEVSSPDKNGELEMGVVRAALGREITWLPAVENRGEGVFIGFSKKTIAQWEAREAVGLRGRQLLSGFDAWKMDHQGTKRKFPGLPYIMLQSLSHLLITAVALECGYPASSIRERVYASDTGYGILLYTGSQDAEGTLGGLVEVGQRISGHLRTALTMGRLCSNDPVCAQHDPASTHERRFLHGAACHGCLLIAETSCEQHNDFLDRALVVPTLTQTESPFFTMEGIA